MLLSTKNLKMKGTPGKLQRRFVGPFQVIETIGQQAYRLSLFHVSLLKNWRTANLQEDQPVTPDDAPEVEEPYYEIEKFYGGEKSKGTKRL